MVEPGLYLHFCCWSTYFSASGKTLKCQPCLQDNQVWFSFMVPFLNGPNGTTSPEDTSSSSGFVERCYMWTLSWPWQLIPGLTEFVSCSSLSLTFTFQRYACRLFSGSKITAGVIVIECGSAINWWLVQRVTRPSHRISLYRKWVDGWFSFALVVLHILSFISEVKILRHHLHSVLWYHTM